MSTPFFVVAPAQINDLNLISTSVPENDYQPYSASTPYQVGSRVIVTTGYHRIYESLIANNTGNFPPTSFQAWIEVGPTNAWAAFDASGNTLTTSTGSIEFVLTGKRFNAMGFLEVNARSIRVRASHATFGTYYDKTFILPDKAVIKNWYDYVYEPIVRQRQLVLKDIPPITDSTYTVTISSVGVGELSIGTFIVGTATEFGFAQYNATVGIIDYSKKDVDQFGRATLVKRNFSKRMDVQVVMEGSKTDAIALVLQDLRATPALWVGAQNSFEAMTIYGFYRDFSIDIAYPTQTVGSLSIEGLT